MIFNSTIIACLYARIFAFKIADMNFKFMDPPHQIQDNINIFNQKFNSRKKRNKLYAYIRRQSVNATLHL